MEGLICFERVHPLAVRRAVLSACEPVRLDAGPVAQHHLVGRGGYIRASRKGLDEKLAGLCRERGPLLPANRDEPLDTLWVENRRKLSSEFGETRRRRAFFLLFLFSRYLLCREIILYVRVPVRELLVNVCSRWQTFANVCTPFVLPTPPPLTGLFPPLFGNGIVLLFSHRDRLADNLDHAGNLLRRQPETDKLQVLVGRHCPQGSKFFDAKSSARRYRMPGKVLRCSRNSQLAVLSTGYAQRVPVSIDIWTAQSIASCALRRMTMSGPRQRAANSF